MGSIQEAGFNEVDSLKSGDDGRATTEPTQFPLPFGTAPRYEDDDFVEDESNQAALEWLRRGDWPDNRLSLWGPGGSGKTHLLHIWVRTQNAVLLNGPELYDLEAIPDLVPDAGALALDNSDRVQDEHLLLHILNTARDRGLRLLLASQEAPARWPVQLADLASRLRAISAVPILPPSDALLQALLMREFARRQIRVAPAVQAWILKHMPRSPAALLDAVHRMDQESLTTSRSITRDLAARVMAGGSSDPID